MKISKKLKIILFAILFIGLYLLFNNVSYGVTAKRTSTVTAKRTSTSQDSSGYSLNIITDNPYGNYSLCGDGTESYTFSLRTQDGKWTLRDAQEEMNYEEADSGTNTTSPIVGYILWFAENAGYLDDIYRSDSPDNEYYEAFQNILYAVYESPYDEKIIDKGLKDYMSFGLSELAAYGYCKDNILVKRAKDYSIAYEQIFKNISSGQSLFTLNSGSANVNVDQKTGEYTVGPYTLRLNTSASTEAKQILYDELIDKSPSTEGFADNAGNQLRFAYFDGVENVNAETNTLRMIDKSGNVIKFPNFVTGEAFYFRFKPKNNGAISQVYSTANNAKFTITFLKNFSVDWKKYECNSVKYADYNSDDLTLDIHNTKDGTSGSVLDLNFLKSDNVTLRKVNAEDKPEGSGDYKSGWIQEEFYIRIKFSLLNWEAANLNDQTWDAANKIIGDDEDGQYIELGPVALAANVGTRPDEYGDLRTRCHYGTGKGDEDYIPGLSFHDKAKEKNGESEIYWQFPEDAWNASGELTLTLEGGFTFSNSDIRYGYHGNSHDFTNIQTQYYFLLSISGTIEKHVIYAPYFIINYTYNESSQNITTTTTIPKKEINMEIQGVVWIDQKDATKTNDRGNGTKDDSDTVFPGIEVRLYEFGTNTLIATTTTDENGRYWFFGLDPSKQGTEDYKVPLMNPLKKYYVIFVYNGQYYQSTYYKNSLSTDKLYSNAEEKDEDGAVEVGRNTINKRFEKISSSNQSYSGLNGINNAYGYNTIIKDENGNPVSDGMTFGDVWEMFLDISNYSKSHSNNNVVDAKNSDGNVVYNRSFSYNDVYNTLQQQLLQKGFSSYTTTSLINFIKDCMITAESGNSDNYVTTSSHTSSTDYQGTTSTSSAESPTTRMTLYPSYDQYSIADLDKDSAIYKGYYVEIDYTKTTVKFVPDGTTRTINGSSSNDSSINPDKESQLSDAYTASQNWNAKTNKGIRYPNINAYAAAHPEYTIPSTDNGHGSITIQGGTPVYIPNPPITINVEFDSTSIGGTEYKYLYTEKWNQAANVNLGLFARQENDLALQKDVYKATVMVNGQKQEYKYNKKETTLDQYGDKIWTVSLRAADALYNGSTVYDREVRSSDYLYTADENAKNLQIYVTYKIAVKNIGTVDAKVDEIVDYYDANNYEFDGSLNGNQYTIKSRTDHETNSTFVQSFIGNRKGTKINDNLKVYENSQTGIGTNTNQNETLSSSGANYNTLYLTGITDTEGNEWLEPGKTAYVYLTFKVKTDPNTGKPKLDEALTTSNGQTVYSAGKRNMSEINCYETRYTNGQKLPDYIKDDGTLIDYDATHQSAGIVDFNSNPGNLVSQDLLDNGKINYSKADGKQLFNYGTLKKEDDPTIKYTYVENDTDQAPNIRIIIGQGDDGNRAMSGYVYEDSRTETMQSAMIGNGVCEDETKINGVTIKLIELVQNVDSDGMPLGTYSREEEVVPHLFDNNARLTGYDTSRYYSGIGTGRVLYTATDTNSIFYIKSSASLSQLDGKYSLDSMPAGNYYIEFVYGDTDQTVLTNNKINGGNLVIGYQDDGTVNNLLNQYGLNAKSYNGQDFKSTVYQAGISQSGSYRGINGFTNPETQDYNKSDVTNKSYMYYYDIAASSSKQGASDAKDSYYRRQANIDYSATLRNHNSEVLDSFEKLGQVNANEDQATLQRSLINELEAQTYMEARTGIINTEIEYNRKESGTNNKRSSNVYSGNSDDATDLYKIEDIDLGLQERPRSQLMLNKKVSGLSVVLANGQTLFNTTQSANNLAYTEHKYHAYGTADSSNPNAIHYNNNFKDTTDKRLFGVALSGTSKDTPELIQSYIDDEIMEGAQLTVHYLLTVKNVGETDYSDKTFYYTGNENNASANLVKTTPNVVIDYLTNDAKYDQSLQQDENSVWVTATADDLVPSGKSGSSFERDAVNHTYYDKLQTYNTILITQSLGKALSPTCANDGSNSSSTTLTTSGILTSTTGSNLTYNNLSEIIISSNTVGRRMQFSIVGNQEMSDQSLGNNASENVYTSVDLVTPKEVDADSAQKIVFMPPTGANKNYVPMIIASIIALGFVLAGAIIIRKKNK